MFSRISNEIAIFSYGVYFMRFEGTCTSRGELISPDQQFKQKISPYIIGKCERGYKATERSVATSSVNVESETNVAE